MSLGKAAGMLAILSLLTASPTVWAATHYEVKGEATVEVMPDVATLVVPLSGSPHDGAEIKAHFGVTSDQLILMLKLAGASDLKVGQGYGPSAGRRFASLQVFDFSLLPKLTQIATESDYKNWNVYYDLFDRAKFAATVDAAAIADATRKAEVHARRLGLKGARLFETKNLRTCFGEPSDCETVGEPPTEIVVVTATRRGEPDRTDFSVPPPRSRTLTANVDATFELQ